MALQAELVPLIDRFQVDKFLKLMHKQIQYAGECGNFPKRLVNPQARGKLTLEDMLCFQKDPIPMSLLKLDDNILESLATKFFEIILEYMGMSARATPISLDERVLLVGNLYRRCFNNAELRDELFVQILKQTRGNPDRESLVKAWEIMYVCAAGMSPCKDIGGYLSGYADQVAHGVANDPEIRALALNALNALKRSVKAVPRNIVPWFNDISALLTGRKFTAKVFFMDKTFKEITYDMSTTVADAVEEIAGIIKLSRYSTFGLFECRKVATDSESPDSWNEDYIRLDDDKHIWDLMVGDRRGKEDILLPKLIFKKKIFLESDEAMTDPMFLQLSYIQLKHDYILGNYGIGMYEALQLSALQMVAEIGYVGRTISSTDWDSFLERFLPINIGNTQERSELVLGIRHFYHSLEYLTKEEAMQRFLHTHRKIPYGNSVFFNVGTIDDPIGLLPNQIILGINMRGVHFFSPVTKQYFHSADLRDIMEFGSSRTAVYFAMRVAGDLSIFQFETEQGEEIAVALGTIINDTMPCCNSEAGSATVGCLNGLNPSDSDLWKVVEESKRNADHVSKMLQELEGLKEFLKADKLRSLCDEKDKALEATELETKDMEAIMANLDTETEPIEENKQVLQKLQDELQVCKDELLVAQETIKRLTSENLIMEQKLSRLDINNSQEIQVMMGTTNTTVIEVEWESMCSSEDLTPIKYIKDIRMHMLES